MKRSNSPGMQIAYISVPPPDGQYPAPDFIGIASGGLFLDDLPISYLGGLGLDTRLGFVAAAADLDLTRLHLLGNLALRSIVSRPLTRSPQRIR